MTRTLSSVSFVLLLVVLSACGGGGGGGGGGDSGGSTVTTGVRCARLVDMSIVGARVTSASLVAATGSQVEYCSIVGRIGTQSLIELRLPTQWSQRYIHIGGGNFDGNLPSLDSDTSGAVTALRRGFAVAASDGGHEGDPSQPGGARFDLTFALNNPGLLLDFTYRAIGNLDAVAKQVMTSYYAGATKYSYFSGCSAGGREALNAATFFPQNYDGIVAGAPAVSQAGSLAARIKAHAQLFNAPGAFLTPGKIATIQAATLATCDSLDGIKDGIISNPAACHFDFASLRCGSAETDACLTDPQIESAKTIRDDTTLSDGTLVYSHYGVGAENLTDGNWEHYSTEWSPNPAPENFLLANAMLKFAIFGDPNYDWRTFNLDRDYPRVLGALSAVNWQLDPAGFQTYASSGKKLLMWQGVSDYSISFNETARFYGDMVNALGGQSQADAFSRLYFMPGVQHCGGGPGAGIFDQIGAITDWVELGKSPQGLIAANVNAAGATTLTRPLCSYPLFPRYTGIGDPNQAQSFTCANN
jgi:Tannase and feruloyl esterase